MNEQPKSQEAQSPLINEIEREAIEFAQSILNQPKKGEHDPLTAIERKAMNYARQLLSKFGVEK